jgi:hypothetical protein
MRPSSSWLVAVASMLCACGGDASVITAGMTSGEVRTRLGNAPIVFSLADHKEFGPRAARCLDQAPVRVMVYERRFRNDVLVYVGADDRVQCVEESEVIDIRTP